MTNLLAGRSLDVLIAKEVMNWTVVSPCSNFYGHVSRPKENNLNEDAAYVSHCICHVCPVIFEPKVNKFHRRNAPWENIKTPLWAIGDNNE